MGPHVVPWSSWSEWSIVARAFSEFPDNLDSFQTVLDLVDVWRAKRQLPIAIEMTDALIRALLVSNNSVEMTSERIIPSVKDRLALALAITRSVSFLSDMFQTGKVAKSVHFMATSVLNLPQSITEFRHDSIHGVLPTWNALVGYGFELLAWWKHNYWGPQWDYGVALDTVLMDPSIPDAPVLLEYFPGYLQEIEKMENALASYHVNTLALDPEAIDYKEKLRKVLKEFSRQIPSERFACIILPGILLDIRPLLHVNHQNAMKIQVDAYFDDIVKRTHSLLLYLSMQHKYSFTAALFRFLSKNLAWSSSTMMLSFGATGLVDAKPDPPLLSSSPSSMINVAYFSMRWMLYMLKEERCFIQQMFRLYMEERRENQGQTSRPNGEINGVSSSVSGEDSCECISAGKGCDQCINRYLEKHNMFEIDFNSIIKTCIRWYFILCSCGLENQEPGYTSVSLLKELIDTCMNYQQVSEETRQRISLLQCSTAGLFVIEASSTELSTVIKKLEARIHSLSRSHPSNPGAGSVGWLDNRDNTTIRSSSTTRLMYDPCTGSCHPMGGRKRPRFRLCNPAEMKMISRSPVGGSVHPRSRGLYSGLTREPFLPRDLGSLLGDDKKKKQLRKKQQEADDVEEQRGKETHIDKKKTDGENVDEDMNDKGRLKRTQHRQVNAETISKLKQRVAQLLEEKVKK